MARRTTRNVEDEFPSLSERNIPRPATATPAPIITPAAPAVPPAAAPEVAAVQDMDIQDSRVFTAEQNRTIEAFKNARSGFAQNIPNIGDGREQFQRLSEKQLEVFYAFGLSGNLISNIMNSGAARDVEMLLSGHYNQNQTRLASNRYPEIMSELKDELNLEVFGSMQTTFEIVKRGFISIPAIGETAVDIEQSADNNLLSIRTISRSVNDINDIKISEIMGLYQFALRMGYISDVGSSLIVNVESAENAYIQLCLLVGFLDPVADVIISREKKTDLMVAFSYLTVAQQAENFRKIIDNTEVGQEILNMCEAIKMFTVKQAVNYSRAICRILLTNLTGERRNLRNNIVREKIASGTTVTPANQMSVNSFVEAVLLGDEQEVLVAGNSSNGSALFFKEPISLDILRQFSDLLYNLDIAGVFKSTSLTIKQQDKLKQLKSNIPKIEVVAGKSGFKVRMAKGSKTVQIPEKITLKVPVQITPLHFLQQLYAYAFKINAVDVNLAHNVFLLSRIGNVTLKNRKLVPDEYKKILNKLKRDPESKIILKASDNGQVVWQFTTDYDSMMNTIELKNVFAKRVSDYILSAFVDNETLIREVDKMGKEIAMTLHTDSMARRLFGEPNKFRKFVGPKQLKNVKRAASKLSAGLPREIEYNESEQQIVSSKNMREFVKSDAAIQFFNDARSIVGSEVDEISRDNALNELGKYKNVMLELPRSFCEDAERQLADKYATLKLMHMRATNNSFTEVPQNCKLGAILAIAFDLTLAGFSHAGQSFIACFYAAIKKTGNKQLITVLKHATRIQRQGKVALMLDQKHTQFNLTQYFNYLANGSEDEDNQTLITILNEGQKLLKPKSEGDFLNQLYYRKTPPAQMAFDIGDCLLKRDGFHTMTLLANLDNSDGKCVASVIAQFADKCVNPSYPYMIDNMYRVPTKKGFYKNYDLDAAMIYEYANRLKSQGSKEENRKFMYLLYDLAYLYGVTAEDIGIRTTTQGMDELDIERITVMASGLEAETVEQQKQSLEADAQQRDQALSNVLMTNADANPGKAQQAINLSAAKPQIRRSARIREARRS